MGFNPMSIGVGFNPTGKNVLRAGGMNNPVHDDVMAIMHCCCAVVVYWFMHFSNYSAWHAQASIYSKQYVGCAILSSITFVNALWIIR